jgi:hypothetical protein
MLPPIEHVAVEIYNLALPTLQEAFDINPIAAMPSLHAALPALCALIGLHEFGRRSWPLFAWAALVVFAIVYLGEHYLVDAVAGVLLAGAVSFVVYRVDFAALALAGRMPRVHPVLLSLLLIAVAQGVGDLTIRIQGGWQADRAFIEREMAGRSALAPLLLGRLALAEGRLAEARPLLDEAARTMRDPERRREASLLLAQAAYRQGDFAATIDALAPDLRARRLGPQALTLLAVAYWNDGRRGEGAALLEELAERFPHDPEPLHWLTKYRWAERLLAPADALQVVARLEAFGDVAAAEAFGRTRIPLVEREGQ